MYHPDLKKDSWLASNNNTDDSLRNTVSVSNYNPISSNGNWNYKKLNRTKYSAGILPYSFDQTGNLYFLLGRDKEGYWSDFGGRCEFKDHQIHTNTAIREFYEETLGSVLSISDCQDKISKVSPITSKTLNGSPYYMYLIYIDYSNYTETFLKTNAFLKYHYANDNKAVSRLIEKNNIRWVSMDTLLNCIERKNQLISLRGVFHDTITSCREILIELKQ